MGGHVGISLQMGLSLVVNGELLKNLKLESSCDKRELSRG